MAHSTTLYDDTDLEEGDNIRLILDWDGEEEEAVVEVGTPGDDRDPNPTRNVEQDGDVIGHINPVSTPVWEQIASLHISGHGQYPILDVEFL